LDSVRELFPVITRFRAYLDTASAGLTPSTVYRALSEALEEYASRARFELAELVGASPDKVAFTVRTTEVLKNVLRSLAVGLGDTVVGVDMDFPTVTSLVGSLCRFRGCKVRVVGGKGIYRVDDLRRTPDDTVKAVVISSIQWISG